MSDGFVLGTLAAIAWGLADVLVTYLSRRGGFLRTLLLTQGFGVALLVVVALALDELPGPSLPQLLALVALGPVAVAAYAGFYRALELGPIAIVSPIVSANGAIVVLLAVLVLGESLSTPQALGCFLVLAFIVLAGYEPNAGPAERDRSGIRLAFAASLAFGVYVFVLATMSEELGWLVPILVARSVTVALVAAVVVARPPPPRESLGRLGLLGCALAGLLDAAGYLVFNRGAELGEVAITSAAASAYPVIPILVGLFALRERVAWHQVAGVGGVLCGMVVLSLG
ncbi:MAG TPA: EamA family transporter [Thermoleophilaceae bacterium]|nr:EamA family transporter [Thermoleophilaceae bacterium]